MKSILLTILNFIIAASTLDIDCEYKFIETKLQDLKLDTIDHVKISNRYTCVADQFLGNDDKNIGAVNGQHLEGLSNVDVRAITFTTIEVSKIPQGLGKVFPNLMSLSVDDFGLEVIYSSDLRDFKNLTFFSAMGNSFEILNSDLFINNPKIQMINFAENNLKHIGAQFIDYLPNLAIALFVNNECIDTNFEIQQNIRRMSVKLEMMKKELQKSCPPHEEDVQSDYYYNYGPYNQQMNFYQNPFFGSNNMEYYSNQYGPTSYYYNYIDQDYYNYLDFYKYDQNPIKEDRFVVVPPKNNTENDNEKIPQEQEKFDYNYNEKDTKGNSTETTTQKSINGTQIDHETNAKNEKSKLGGKKETKNSIFEHDKTGK